MALVISVLADDRPGIVEALSGLILEHGGNIEDSRMAVLGGVFAVSLLADCPADTEAALAAALQRHAEAEGLSLALKPAGERGGRTEALPYQARVVAMDHPGIVNRIAGFFSGQGINIRRMDTARYRAAHTATPMFSAELLLDIPAQAPLPRIREGFLTLCDEYNLDGSLEPVRPE